MNKAQALGPHWRAMTGTFPHERSSCEVWSSFLLSHCGLADAISREQIFDAAKLLRSDGRPARTQIAVLHVIVCEMPD
jgi:hypothetical protein